MSPPNLERPAPELAFRFLGVAFRKELSFSRLGLLAKQGHFASFLSYLGNGSAPTFLCTSIHFPSRFT